jgi:DNA phosphorothioation-associated putative methyltransferase
MHEGIARHKTAISRTELSRPVKLALGDGILTPDRSFFDYGCGLGDDLRFLAALGIDGRGWDPVHRAESSLSPSPVVNIGYVVNVIENPDERREALRRAWGLAEQVLIVSARLSMDARFQGESQDYADGFLTSRGTFQKFFDQFELRNWIDQTLGLASVPAAPGVFYAFRDDQVRAAFVASRYRRRLAAPRLTRSAQLFSAHQELLQPLLDFVSERGRLPADDELSCAAAVCEVFGSIRRAFRVITQVTDAARWDAITEDRTQDLLIYLALSRFDGRPNFSRLPREMQRDVKGFFSSYKEACDKADAMLLSVGQAGIVETACQNSGIGKLTPAALYVHESALGSLSPILRLFEGCAQGYVGRVDGASIVKLHRQEPKVSYLSYPNFEGDPHPALAFSLTVDLQTFRVKFRDWRSRRNPPILHRKELFLCKEDPLHAKFARLTRIEEQKGLYEDPSRIGTQDGWNNVLANKGLCFRGHRLINGSG